MKPNYDRMVADMISGMPGQGKSHAGLIVGAVLVAIAVTGIAIYLW